MHPLGGADADDPGSSAVSVNMPGHGATTSGATIERALKVLHPVRRAHGDGFYCRRRWPVWTRSAAAEGVVEHEPQYLAEVVGIDAAGKPGVVRIESELLDSHIGGGVEKSLTPQTYRGRRPAAAATRSSATRAGRGRGRVASWEKHLID